MSWLRYKTDRSKQQGHSLSEKTADNQYRILAERLRYSVGFFGFVAIEHYLSDDEVAGLAEDITEGLIGNSSPLIVAVDRQRGIRKMTDISDAVRDRVNEYIGQEDERGPAMSKKHKLMYADLPPNYSVLSSIFKSSIQYVEEECNTRDIGSAHIYTPVMLVPDVYTKQLGLKYRPEAGGQLHLLHDVSDSRSQGLIWDNVSRRLLSK